MGLGRVGTPTGKFAQEETVPLALQGIEETVLDDFSEARTTEFLCKRLEVQSKRLTTCLSLERRVSLFLAANQCVDALLPL